MHSTPPDEYRYKIVGHQGSSLDKETEVWIPTLFFETDVIWEFEVAQQSLDHLKDRFPDAQLNIMKTRDAWERVT